MRAQFAGRAAVAAVAAVATWSWRAVRAPAMPAGPGQPDSSQPSSPAPATVRGDEPERTSAVAVVAKKQDSWAMRVVGSDDVSRPDGRHCI